MEKQEKIVFMLPPGSVPTAETMWADIIHDGVYQLDNIPIYTPFISIEDKFEAEIIDASDPRRHFTKLVKRSQNVTHRISILNENGPSSEVREAIERLRGLMDGFESDNCSVFAFNISIEAPDKRKSAITRELSKGQSKQWWQWEISSAPTFPLTNVENFLKDHPNVMW